MAEISLRTISLNFEACAIGTAFELTRSGQDLRRCGWQELVHGKMSSELGPRL